MSIGELTQALERCADEHAAGGARSYRDRLLGSGVCSSLSATLASEYAGDLRRTYLAGVGACMKRVPDLVRLGVEAA